MSESSKTELEEVVDMLVGFVDEEKIRTSAKPSDPMLEMIWQKLQDGVDFADAIHQLLEELDTLSIAILDILDYPPRAIMGIELARKLEEREFVLEDPQMSAALSYLSKKRLIYEINGWYFKTKPPIAVTQDDIDWLHGTGRFAQ
ncbi:MAG: hypothetical protein U0516_04040 [Candidatus Saccharibacteria bacterium]